MNGKLLFGIKGLGLGFSVECRAGTRNLRAQRKAIHEQVISTVYG